MISKIQTTTNTDRFGRVKTGRLLILVCDQCGITFTHKYFTHMCDGRLHFCGITCSSLSRSCGKLRLQIETTCEERFGTKYAIHTDKARQARSLLDEEVTRKRQETMLQKYGVINALQLPQFKEKRRQTNLKRYGVEHYSQTTEWNQKYVATSMEKYGVPWSSQAEVIREKNANTCSRKVLSGEMKSYLTHRKSGDYTSTRMKRDFFYRSGWELAVMKYLDITLDVASWDYECVRVPYVYDNHKRWYVPDFIITFQDDHREMWEVKPKEFINAKKNLLKIEAGHIWCKNNGLSEYRVITGDELREMKLI